MQVKIVETGVNIKIKVTNEIDFYSYKNFETEKEAKNFLKEHGLKETQ